MRISELSRRTGVSVPTVKYYLREGLLPGGTATSRNQAEYDEGHVRRLRLIRTLREVGDLDIERIRAVTAAIDDETLSRHDVFGAVERARQRSLAPGGGSEDALRARTQVDRFLDELGWRVRPDAAARHELAEALAALWRLGREYGTDVFRPYAEVADRMAAWEVAAVADSEPRSVAVERMIVGTVVFGAVFDALRRMAHEHHSAAREGAERGPVADRSS